MLSLILEVELVRYVPNVGDVQAGGAPPFLHLFALWIENHFEVLGGIARVLELEFVLLQLNHVTILMQLGRARLSRLR